MATAVKFQSFIEGAWKSDHRLFGENDVVSEAGVAQLKVYLTNTTPNVATMAAKADLAEIALTGGYSGPVIVGTNGTRTGGTFTLQGRSVLVATQAGPTDIGPFRYAVLYNASSAVVANALICYWDLGAPATLTGGSGETVDVRFSNAAIGALGTILASS